jgi:3-deoxy-D-manno-octulosonic-acid transferase
MTSMPVPSTRWTPLSKRGVEYSSSSAPPFSSFFLRPASFVFLLIPDTQRCSLMLWLYRLLFLPVLLVLAPGYLLRMRRRGGYGSGFGQRFGSHPELPPKRAGVKRVWLQAVSVGEMLAIGPLLEGLRADGAEVYLTTTTSTGFRLAMDRYAPVTLGIGYFPLDWWLFSTRAWRRIQPDLVILTEGERWPEHLRQAAKRGVPVLSINARLSDRSFRRLRTFPSSARLMTTGVTRVLPCSAQDEQRFRELGVPASKLFLTGNIKLDVRITPLADAARAQLRRELGLPEGLVLLGSSTWPGEEAAVLEAWRAARAAGVKVSLLIVPRHAERRGEIERLLREAGVRFHFRSTGAASGEVDVAVGDTTGELRNFTQLADLVFVGKSLAPHTEGQTPVEAAVLGRPILFGPGMGNFRLLARDLVARGAAREVADSLALTEAVVGLLQNPSARAALSAAAAKWHRENTGALERTLAIIREEIGSVRSVGR